MRTVLLLLAAAASLAAQTITGTITGSVVDSSSLPMAGVSVTLTQTATGAERAGNSSQSLDLNSHVISIADPNLRQPFPAIILPTSHIDPNGQPLPRAFP